MDMPTIITRSHGCNANHCPEGVCFLTTPKMDSISLASVSLQLQCKLLNWVVGYVNYSYIDAKS
jgi:hypothetical protein